MEPLTRRLSLHIYSDKQEEILAFYRDLVGLRIAKDLVLATGTRWLTLVKEDNIGAQIHIHPINPKVEFRPFRFDLSEPDIDAARSRFTEAGLKIDEFDYPWAWGFSCIDPAGNEVTLSFWGELECDQDAGWDTEFLDYTNSTAPITEQVAAPDRQGGGS